MRYLMKQKLFAWGDDFKIQDEHGRDLFFVDGKVFSMGDKLSFQDLHGMELASVRQKLLSLGKTYEIYRQGQLIAAVKKGLFDFFRASFSVDVPGPDDLEAEGNFLDHEYSFTRHGRPVAQVSKKWFSWTDTYGVDVAEGEDDILILAATVVIDMCCHEDRDK